MATNEENARDIVRQILEETFNKGLPIRLDPHALANRIVDCLAEVELITDEYAD